VTIFGFGFSGVSAAPLLALATVAGIVLLALSRLRPQRPRLLVSFVPLWRDALAAAALHRLGMRWRRWLSFAVHAALVLLLVIAAGQPRRVMA
jgi:hypothetical protein